MNASDLVIISAAADLMDERVKELERDLKHAEKSQVHARATRLAQWSRASAALREVAAQAEAEATSTPMGSIEDSLAKLGDLQELLGKMEQRPADKD